MSVKETVMQDRTASRLKEPGGFQPTKLVYVALLTHSNMTSSMLCKETGIPDSKIYYALDDLSKKGMLFIILEGIALHCKRTLDSCP